METVELSQKELNALLSVIDGFVKNRDLGVGDVIILGKLAEKFDSKLVKEPAKTDSVPTAVEAEVVPEKPTN